MALTSTKKNLEWQGEQWVSLQEQAQNGWKKGWALSGFPPRKIAPAAEWKTDWRTHKAWGGRPVRRPTGRERAPREEESEEAENVHPEKRKVRESTAAWQDGAAAGRDPCQAALAPDLCPPHLRNQAHLQGTPPGSASLLPPPRVGFAHPGTG